MSDNIDNTMESGKQAFFVVLNDLKTRTAWAVFKYCGTKTVPLE